MKEFRIAKCLCYAGTEYAKIKKCAIFKDGSRKGIIQTDQDGHEYFSVDNWIQSNPEMDSFNYGALDFMKLSFTGKPEDMIESIRIGYGDAITSYSFLGRHDDVVYFIDRAYGEKLRKKTIDGWKNARFAYVLLANERQINADGKFVYNKHCVYKSFAEAANLANKLVDKAMKTAGEIEGKPMKDYIGYLGKILGSTEYDLVWMMFKDIYNEGELFVRKKDIDRKKLLRYFTIRQTVVE